LSEIVIGMQVMARGLRWQVVDYQKLDQQCLYRLLSLDNNMRGMELDILSPLEKVEPIISDFQPERAAPLVNWLVYQEAFLLDQALGPEALMAAQPGRLRLEPYQLVPVMRAIKMGRVRLLLADSVGLGKTVQAGIVVCELMARRVAHRILIVSPAGPLLQQWRTEFRERFGINLDVIDRGRLEEIRRSTELGSNPFAHVSFGLASIDFLKQERILELLEKTTYDVVIIDEAHHCMDLGQAQDREGSQRRRLAEVLSNTCDTFILATATPHDGNDRSFASLCELLDPSLVNIRGELKGNNYRSHVVRRLKKHIHDRQTGQPLFKERQVFPCPVHTGPTAYPAFASLQRGILELVIPELKKAFRARRYSDVLAYITLLKRSVSTVNACEMTLRTIAGRLKEILREGEESQEGRKQRLRTLKDVRQRLDRFGVVSFEEEEELSRLDAEDLAQQLASLCREARRESRHLQKGADLIERLDSLIDLAGHASGQDPKVLFLAQAIKDIRANELRANILVYTEYTDSQTAVAEHLRSMGLGEILTLSGADPDPRRQEITSRFCNNDNLVLVSTDASAEGLNLHQRCHNLIHLELPFNPNRLEQRNGRIDRYGQTVNPVIRYLYLAGTFEERILLKLIAKYERQRKLLTFMPDTLGMITSGDTFTGRLLQGLLDEDVKLFHNSQPTLFDLTGPEAEQTDDPVTRDLLEEIDRSLAGFQKAAKTQDWLVNQGLNAEEKLLNDAEAAHATGRKLMAVDLVAFLCKAIQLDNGQVRSDPDGLIIINLPPAWRYGLEDLPGYEPGTSTVRLTTDLNVTYDSARHSVGFIGRAHPLVRRALDRVRSLSYGGASLVQDIRVSAVEAPVVEPQLLVTFLGRLVGQRERGLEKMIAVRIGADETNEAYLEPEEWLSLARQEKAIRTSGIWEHLFSGWGDAAREQALTVAKDQFAILSKAFEIDLAARLKQDRSNMNSWLIERSREITGDPKMQQMALFSDDAIQIHPAAPWQTIPQGVKRLEEFLHDRDLAMAERNKAETALKIYHERMADFAFRSLPAVADVVPLGMLMLVPEVDCHVS
jgi:superfamily II DNA or RNA helicase